MEALIQPATSTQLDCLKAADGAVLVWLYEDGSTSARPSLRQNDSQQQAAAVIGVSLLVQSRAAGGGGGICHVASAGCEPRLSTRSIVRTGGGRAFLHLDLRGAEGAGGRGALRRLLLRKKGVDGGDGGGGHGGGGGGHGGGGGGHGGGGGGGAVSLVCPNAQVVLLPISPHISPYLPISRAPMHRWCCSPYLPISPHISPYLEPQCTGGAALRPLHSRWSEFGARDRDGPVGRPAGGSRGSRL